MTSRRTGDLVGARPRALPGFGRAESAERAKGRRRSEDVRHAAATCDRGLPDAGRAFERALRIVTLFLALTLGGGCALLGGPKLLEPESYSLEFVGRSSFSEDQLIRSALADLNDFVTGGYRKSAVDNAAYAIERHYRDRGFPFATVDYEYEREPDALPVARFVIDEGPRTRLAAVRIAGNSLFGQEELEAFFLRSKNGRTWYVQGEVSSAASGVASLYVSRGYLDVVVAAPVTTFDEARENVTLDVTIHEGPAYKVGSIEFAGEPGFEHDELLARAGAAPGDEYFPRLPYEVRGRLGDFYANRGHADVEVEVERTIDPARAVVDLVYKIDPGPVVTIGDVRVEGNTKTNASFVLSRLDVKPGTRFDRDGLRQGASRLYETGLFNRVDISVPKDDELNAAEEAERTLLVEIQETTTQEFYVTPGWGSYEALRVTAGVRGRNFFGTGRTVKAEGTLSTKSATGTLTLTDPYFLGSVYTTDLSFFGNRRQEPSFTRLENGATLSFSRNWTRTLRTVAGYEYKRSDAVDVDPDAEAGNNVRLSTLFFAPTLDTRDSFIVPTRGTRNTFGTEWSTSALGSELDFLRFRLGRSQYHPLRPGTVLALRAQTGLIFPLVGTETIPIQERFFNGGEDSVRSFGEDQLGPKDAENNPIGGETFAVGSIELRQRLAGAFGTAVFIDIGNVTQDVSDYLRFDDLRTGIGGGLRYMLPIGPLRLDGAWNPDASGTEDNWVVHFAVGMAF